MKNKFNFYEVVKIKPKTGHLDLSGLDTRKFDYQILVGREGTILGMVQDDNGLWLYDVCFDDESDRYTFREEDISSTGFKKNRSDFYPGETVKVRVDPETGEGEIVDEEG